jgi:hypothetical protein
MPRIPGCSHAHNLCLASKCQCRSSSSSSSSSSTSTPGCALGPTCHSAAGWPLRRPLTCLPCPAAAAAAGRPAHAVGAAGGLPRAAGGPDSAQAGRQGCGGGSQEAAGGAGPSAHGRPRAPLGPHLPLHPPRGGRRAAQGRRRPRRCRPAHRTLEVRARLVPL